MVNEPNAQDGKRLDADVEPPPRKPDEMRRMLEALEFAKQTTVICDSDGEELCQMDYAITGEPLEVRPRPYVNKAQVADNRDEYVYCTDASGTILPDSLTRGRAQAENRRYLVVTVLAFHNKEMLLQKRAADKRLDPDKLSASAHGVAKQLHFQNGQRMRNIDYASIVNTALEANEELRHGSDKPLKVRLWPGTERELFDYAKANAIDDPDTLYVIPVGLYPDAGYPLKENSQPRTRAVSNGFFFSKERPPISIDPSEAQGYEWTRASQFSTSDMVTADGQQVTDESFSRMWQQAMQDPQFRARAAARQVMDMFGLKPGGFREVKLPDDEGER